MKIYMTIYCLMLTMKERLVPEFQIKLEWLDFSHKLLRHPIFWFLIQSEQFYFCSLPDSYVIKSN